MGMARETAEELFGSLQMLERVLRWGFRAQRRPDDPGPGAQATLFYLLRHEPARAKDIAEWLGVGPATQSRQLADLEQHGLIQREPDPEDARAARIRLTEHGRETVLALRDRRIDLVARALEGMDVETADDTVAALRGLVTVVRDGLVQITEGTPGRPTTPAPQTTALPALVTEAGRSHRLNDSKDYA